MGRPTVGITSLVVPSAGGVVVTTVAEGVVVIVGVGVMVVTTEVSPPGFDGGGGGATRLHALSATTHVTAPQNTTIATRPAIVRDPSAGCIPCANVIAQPLGENNRL